MKDNLNKIKQLLISKLQDKNLIASAKHAGKALGFTLVVTLAIITLTNLLYQEKTIIKKGYTPEINTNPTVIKVVGGVSVGQLSDLSNNSAVSIEDLIKTADLKKGKKVFKKCAACHTLEQGAGNKIGPNLYNIINKRKAANPNFKYSKGLEAKGGKWSYQDLNKLLTKPRDFIPGTKMTFAGLKKDKDRANVIAYLKNANK